MHILASLSCHPHKKYMPMPVPSKGCELEPKGWWRNHLAPFERSRWQWIFEDKIPWDATSGIHPRIRYRLSHHRLSHNHCRPRTLLHWYLVSHQVTWKRSRAVIICKNVLIYSKNIYICISTAKNILYIYRHRFLTVAPLKGESIDTGEFLWFTSTCVSSLQSAQIGSNDTFTRRACWITVVLLSCVREGSRTAETTSRFGAGQSTQRGGVELTQIQQSQHNLKNIKQVILDSIGHLS